MALELLLDTSNKDLAVGFANEAGLIYSKQYPAWQKQSEWTMVEIEKGLKTIEKKASDITRVVVAYGPGSYTGVRIALTIAKVLASLAKIPLCPISSLAVIAGNQGKKIALMDARSNRAYVGVYEEGIAIQEDCILELNLIHELMNQFPGFEIVGDANLVHKERKASDVIAHLYALGKVYPNVEAVDAVTPRYIKE